MKGPIGEATGQKGVISQIYQSNLVKGTGGMAKGAKTAPKKNMGGKRDQYGSSRVIK